MGMLCTSVLHPSDMRAECSTGVRFVVMPEQLPSGGLREVTYSLLPSAGPMPDFAFPIVAVPARNEEALLPELISALARQSILDKLAEPLPVIVVLNNTHDRSASVAREAAKLAPEIDLTLVQIDFPPERAHVGSARRLAMEMAAERYPSGVILTTDADAVPQHDWIEANLRAIEAGADIVGGRIVGNAQEEEALGPDFLRRAGTHARYKLLRDELAWLIDPIDHDPWPRHQDHTGASLAVRSEVYRKVGGLDPLRSREDIAFVSKVVAAGFRLSHPLDVAVTVSARTQGRASGGMAECLRNWIREEQEGAPVLLECPRAIENRLQRRRSIRLWQAAAMLSVAAMIERFAPDELDAVGTVPAAIAIAALEHRIASLRGLSHAA